MSEVTPAFRRNPIYLPIFAEAQTNMDVVDSNAAEEDPWAELDDPSSVVVEYEFFNVPETSLQRLPQRVTEAVETLVRRRRVPSDDDVREMVHSNSTPLGSPRSAQVADSARVRVVLAQDVAVNLAMHRSFHEGGNVQRTASLTPQQLLALAHRSHQIATRQARSDNAEDTTDNTCVICMDTLYDNKNRIRLSPCKHAFHKECIVQWLERLPRTCPLCKGNVDLTMPRPSGAITRSRARALRGEACGAEDADQEVYL